MALYYSDSEREVKRMPEFNILQVPCPNGHIVKIPKVKLGNEELQASLHGKPNKKLVNCPICDPNCEYPFEIDTTKFFKERAQ